MKHYIKIRFTPEVLVTPWTLGEHPAYRVDKGLPRDDQFPYVPYKIEWSPRDHTWLMWLVQKNTIGDYVGPPTPENTEELIIEATNHNRLIVPTPPEDTREWLHYDQWCSQAHHYVRKKTMKDYKKAYKKAFSKDYETPWLPPADTLR